VRTINCTASEVTVYSLYTAVVNHHNLSKLPHVLDCFND